MQDGLFVTSIIMFIISLIIQIYSIFKTKTNDDKNNEQIPIFKDPLLFASLLSFILSLILLIIGVIIYFIKISKLSGHINDLFAELHKIKGKCGITKEDFEYINEIAHKIKFK